MEDGEECVGVMDLFLLFLSLLPGAGEEDGLGILVIGGGGFRFTGGRSLTVTELYLALGLDFNYLSSMRSLYPHFIFVLKAGSPCLSSYAHFSKSSALALKDGGMKVWTPELRFSFLTYL